MANICVDDQPVAGGCVVNPPVLIGPKLLECDEAGLWNLHLA